MKKLIIFFLLISNLAFSQFIGKSFSSWCGYNNQIKKITLYQVKHDGMIGFVFYNIYFLFDIEKIFYKEDYENRINYFECYIWSNDGMFVKYKDVFLIWEIKGDYIIFNIYKKNIISRYEYLYFIKFEKRYLNLYD